MVGRMRKRFPTAETILSFSSSPRKTRGGGTFVFIHRCIGNGCERRPDQGRTRQTETYFLYKQNLSGCRFQVPANGKISMHGRDIGPKAKTVFPIPHDRHPHDLPPTDDSA